MRWTPFFLQTLIWPPTRFLFKILLHLRISGKENIAGLPRGVIFAMNHVSELDPILLPASLEPFSSCMPMFYVSREGTAYTHLGLRSFFYGGGFFKAWGAYPVVVGLRDYEKSLATHIELLNEGRNICIFPEGKKSPDAGLQKAKGGIVALAKATGRPIVPVAVSGHFRMTWGEFLLGRRRVMISFGKPISSETLFDGYEDASPHEYGTIVHEKIVSRIASLLDGHMKERALREVCGV